MMMYKSRLTYLCMFAMAAILSSCNTEPTPSEYLEKARIHLAEGALSAATIETRNAVKGDQSSAAARLLLGNLLLESGDAAGAEKELRKARELGVTDAETRPQLASALLNQSKLDELLALSDDGLKPAAAAQLLSARAMGWFASGEIANARKDAEQALDLDPSSTDARLTMARLDGAENQLASATKRVKELLSDSPTSGSAWEFLGDLESFANRPEEALNAYSKSVENSSQSMSARLKRAQLYVQLENADDALKDLDALANAGVKRPDIQLARGQLKLRGGDLIGAQVHFEEALTMAADYAPAIGSLALTHLLQGNLGQAEQYSKRMMTETGNSEQARRLLAAVYLENERYALSEDTIKPVTDSGNTDFASIRLLSTTLLKQGKHDEAVALMTDYLRSIPADAIDAQSEHTSPVLTNLPSRLLYEETVASSSDDSSTPNEAAAEQLLNDNERLIVATVKQLNNGKYDDALNIADTLQASMSESAAPWNLAGRVHLGNKQISEARTAFEQAILKDETNIAARQFLAELDVQAGDLDAARDHLEQIVKAGTENESVILQLSRIEAQAGNESAMLEWIQRSRSSYPDSVATALIMARYQASKQNPQEALNIIDQLDDNVKSRPDVLQLEGATLIILERFTEALPKLERLVELQPGNAQWRYLSAVARAGSGDNPGAIDDLNAALEIDPEHAPSQLVLANVDIQRGQLDDAFTRVKTLRELIPGSPELATIEERYDARKAEPVNAATNDAGNSTTTLETTEQVLSAARQLWSDNERDKAFDLMNTWLEANPEDFATRLTLANSYVLVEQTDVAIQQYETVLKINEQNLTPQARLVTYNNLAWYLRDIDSEKALSYAQNAVDAAPDSLAALDTLAMIFLARDNPQAAKSAFDKALELGAEDPTILFHGATIENALGNKDAALSLLKPLSRRQIRVSRSRRSISPVSGFAIGIGINRFHVIN